MAVLSMDVTLGTWSDLIRYDWRLVISGVTPECAACTTRLNIINSPLTRVEPATDEPRYLAVQSVTDIQSSTNNTLPAIFIVRGTRFARGTLSTRNGIVRRHRRRRADSIWTRDVMNVVMSS